MKASILKKMIYAGLMSLICVQTYDAKANAHRRKYVGMFKDQDPRIEGILFGNWGSRPYEYAWASTVVDVKGKRVIDLGIGLPSEFKWYEYVINNLQPDFYAGIDSDGRMISEQVKGENYELKFMSATQLKYEDKSFDVAYCISTFQLMPFDMMIKSIAQIHRILKDDGLLVITFDEEWDNDAPLCHGNGWNILEQDLIRKDLFTRATRPFGLPEFISLIQDYFELFQSDAIIDIIAGEIRSNKDNFVYYGRKDKDDQIINSKPPTNSCVSYALMKKAR